MDVNFYSCSRSFIFTYHVDTDNKTRFLPFLVVSFPLLRRPLKQINGEDKQHVCYAWLKDHGQKFVSSLHILAKQPWPSFQNFLDFQVLAKQQMLVINPSFSFFGWLSFVVCFVSWWPLHGGFEVDLSAIPKIPKGDDSNWWAVHGKHTSTGRGDDGRCIPSPS